MRRGSLACGTAWRLGRGVLLAGFAAVSTLVTTQSAFADAAPVATSAALPWAYPAHESPLELLAGQIASHIAGRPVAVHCEDDTGWAKLVTQTGGDPNAESGYVTTSWNGTTGQLISSSSIAELASNVCLPLNDFAMAATKPTKCSSPQPARLSLAARAKSTKRALPLPGPCYFGVGEPAARMPAGFWTKYSAYAVAILTLAHESIHLSGIVGGQLSNGLPVGDQQAEAKADCYGMQWMAYVAERLGDTRDDAQAITTYFWDKIYPLNRASNHGHWSPDCRPGGSLDARPPGAVAWP